MELWVTGTNTRGQLTDLDPLRIRGGEIGTMPPIGEACLHGLQRVITGDNIKHFEVLLSDTEMTAVRVVFMDGTSEIRKAGKIYTEDSNFPSHVIHMAELSNEVVGSMTGEEGFIAEALCGTICWTCMDGTSPIIQKFEDWDKFAEAEVKREWGLGPGLKIKQVIANDISFTALVEQDGYNWVYTWGQKRRHPHVLGRLKEGRISYSPLPVESIAVGPDHPDHRPGLVTKISTGGYASAALKGTSIFVWGAHIWGEGVTQFDVAVPFEAVEWEFLDVAVGTAHMAVLTTNHEVLIAGKNSHGQLGQGKEVKESSWTQLPLPLGNRRVVGVYAGQYATYLAVEVIPEDEAGVAAAVASEVDNSTTLEAQETNMDCPISLGNTSMMPIKH